VFLEPNLAPAQLLIFGATPVALELLKLARVLGYSTTLVESRGDRITPGHRAAAHATATTANEAASQNGGLSARTDAVFTDHDAPDVVDDVAALLKGPTRFIGVMGSRRHVAPHREALKARGVNDADIERVHSPVGLNIGASTPAEIALSIAAGLVAAREGREGEWMDRNRGRD
jgi:xanthine/CO dehydrogenase XdhC/CoxF family maturation factor